MLKSRFFYFLLLSVTGFSIAFIFSCSYFVNVFKDDIFGRGLALSDLLWYFKSFGLLGICGIFTYTISFSVLNFIGKFGKIKAWVFAGLVSLILISGFFVRSTLLPHFTLTNYAWYWTLLTGDNYHNAKMVEKPKMDLFKNSYYVVSYSEASRQIDSLQKELDTFKIKQLKQLRTVTSNSNAEKFAKTELFEKTGFNPDEIKGGYTDPQTDADLARTGFTRQKYDSLRYYVVEGYAQNYVAMKQLREQTILRFKNEQSKMLFFPVHACLAFCICYLVGLMLQHMKTIFRFMLSTFILAPFFVFMPVIFDTRIRGELPPVARQQFIQLCFEIAILVVLFIVYRNKVKNALRPAGAG